MVTKPERIEDTITQATLYLRTYFPEPFDPFAEILDTELPELNRLLQTLAREFSVDIVPVRSEPRSLGERSHILALFGELEKEAASMGHDIPSADVIAEARRIFARMPFSRHLEYDVYSMPDGGVAIGINGTFGRAMVLICEPGKSALCVVTIDRVSRRARYDDSGFLPDAFVREGLRSLTPSRESVTQ